MKKKKKLFYEKIIEMFYTKTQKPKPNKNKNSPKYIFTMMVWFSYI